MVLFILEIRKLLKHLKKLNTDFKRKLCTAIYFSELKTILIYRESAKCESSAERVLKTF